MRAWWTYVPGVRAWTYVIVLSAYWGTMTEKDCQKIIMVLCRGSHLIIATRNGRAASLTSLGEKLAATVSATARPGAFGKITKRPFFSRPQITGYFLAGRTAAQSPGAWGGGGGRPTWLPAVERRERAGGPGFSCRARAAASHIHRMFVLLPQRPRQGPAAYIPRGCGQAGAGPLSAVGCRGRCALYPHPRKHAVWGA